MTTFGMYVQKLNTKYTNAPKKKNAWKRQRQKGIKLIVVELTDRNEFKNVSDHQSFQSVSTQKSKQALELMAGKSNRFEAGLKQRIEVHYDRWNRW